MSDWLRGLFGGEDAVKPDMDALRDLYQQGARQAGTNHMTAQQVAAQQMAIQQAAAQQRAMMQQWSGTTTTTVAGGLSNAYAPGEPVYTMPNRVYKDLELAGDFRDWCRDVHPEVYDEWRAMQDLKRVSQDEST